MANIWVYDIESFKYDWVVVFLNVKTDEVIVAHNDNQIIQSFLQNDPILIGFNNKMFDDYILKALANDASPTIIKEISDFIIAGNLPWEHWFISELPYSQMSSADVRNDMYRGLSLKSIEGHLGMPIVESSVPFDIDRPLTDSEIEEVITYCKHDVRATLKIFELRENYFKTKLRLAKLGRIHPRKALGMTNAKLTAAYLGAKATVRSDGREYEFPPELDQSVLPEELLTFFKLIENPHITDDALYETSIIIDILGVPCKFAWGGVHGTLEQYHGKATDEVLIGHRDVGSLYPSLMVHYDYISRNISSPELFKQTYHKRMEAKATGHADATTLKLPLNTASGAMENQYNDMYDPKQPRAVRITGQLLMAELVLKIGQNCPTFKLLNLNTDGFMYEINKAERDCLDRVCTQWEEEKHLNLEEKEIEEIWIKDVNNVLFVTTSGRITATGSYLNYGISESAGWTISNNATVVADAIINYFVHKIPVKETVYNENDPIKFQLIAHASSKYSSVYQHNADGKHFIQKTNRVYASKNKSNGGLFKVKHGKQKGEKIANLPNHCLIDNERTVQIEQIDKDWYINLAQKRINDYTGGSTWQQMTFLR